MARTPPTPEQQRERDRWTRFEQREENSKRARYQMWLWSTASGLLREYSEYPPDIAARMAVERADALLKKLFPKAAKEYGREK